MGAREKKKKKKTEKKRGTEEGRAEVWGIHEEEMRGDGMQLQAGGEGIDTAVNFVAATSDQLTWKQMRNTLGTCRCLQVAPCGSQK